MNPDFPNPVPSDPEARITALLLGELPPADAAEVRQAIERDPELAKLEQRLRQAIDLTREALRQPAPMAAPQPASPRFQAARREALLAAFKTLAPPELKPRPRRDWSWFVPMSVAASLILLIGVGGLLLPALAPARSKGMHARWAAPEGAGEERFSWGRKLTAPGVRESTAGTEARGERGGEGLDPQSSAGLGLDESGRARGRELTGRPSRPEELRQQVQELRRRTEVVQQNEAKPEGRLAAGYVTSSPDGNQLAQAQGARSLYLGAGLKLQEEPPVDRLNLAAPAAEQPVVEKVAPVVVTDTSATRGAAAVATAAESDRAAPAARSLSESLHEKADTLAEGVEVAQKPAAQPAPEPRMLMRYGLRASWAPAKGTPTVPSRAAGETGLALSGASAPAAPPAAPATPAPATERAGLVPSAGTAGAAPTDLGAAVARSELEALALKLPTPAFMGTPTELPAGASGGPAPAQQAAAEWGMIAQTPAVRMKRLADTETLDFTTNRAQAGQDYFFSDQRAGGLAQGGAGGFGGGVAAGGGGLGGFGGVPAGGRPTAERLYRNNGVSTFFRMADDAAVAGSAPPAANGREPLLAGDFKAKFGEALVPPPQLHVVVPADAAPEPAAQRQTWGDFDGDGALDVLAKAPRADESAAFAVPTEGATAARKFEPTAGTLEKALTTAPAAPVEISATPTPAALATTLGDTPQLGRAFGKEVAVESRDLVEEVEISRFSVIEAKVQAEAEAKDKAAKAAEKSELREKFVADAGVQLHDEEAAPANRPAPPPPEPQPDVLTAENPFSTFSLNVTDVSFKLAASSLENGRMPEAASIRTEEFINAFDYRDPEPAPGMPIAFAFERARYPFAHNRDLLRFSVQTAARGREPGRPLNLVLVLDSSGSMERADRVRIIQEALQVLAGQLQAQDRISVVAFARTARLWIDGLPGSQAGELVERVGNLTPEGGTNLEDALKVGYETALRHFLPEGVNRVILLTDGAANLGDLDPASLEKQVESHRARGVALDCFGIGWEGYNDDLLEVLSRHGDGRYGFINSPEEAATGFADQLAGALEVAAADVKVQVEFNPRRTEVWRQIGYAKHQLTKEQFRDNTVDAAELGAAESGNALYVVQVNPQGDGPIGVVRVRYRVPATGLYHEHEFPVPYTGASLPLEQSSPASRLAASASAFADWLASSPFAAEVTTDRLLALMGGVPEAFAPDPRPKKLEWMIRQAKSVTGR